MEFGLQTRGNWEYVLACARWAEERGDIEAIALPDHYLSVSSKPDEPAWDHLAHIAALATQTSRIGLMSLVTPVTFRHPGVLYKMGVTIDEISGGRFTLGLGAGWMDEEFELFGLPYPELKVRMEMYEEAMAYLRAAITPGANGFDGKHYQLSEFDPHPHPTGLRLAGGGAGGARARHIAVNYADEYNLYVRKADEYAWIVTATRDLAIEMGRKPDELFWSSAGPGLAARSESNYRRLMEGMADLTGRSPEYIEERWEERGVPHGSGAKGAEMIVALEEAGCQRFYPQVFLRDDDPSDFDLILDAFSGS